MSESHEPRATPPPRPTRRWAALAAVAAALVLVAGVALGVGSAFFGWPSRDTTSPTPSQSASAAPLALDAGGSHTCVLTASGEAQCWGGNWSGEVGTGVPSQIVRRPTSALETGPGSTSLSAGVSGTCVVTALGGVRCWGSPGGLATGSGPADVPALSSGVTSVSVGAMHQCAVTEDGGIMCWGDNTDGQLGDGSTTARSAPVAVEGLSAPAIAVASGLSHSCAVTSSGGVLCWGDNEMGQLGNGTQKDRTEATPVTGLSSGVRAVTAGAWHTCAIRETGGVVCWGNGRSGQLGDGTTAGHAVPVDVSGLTDAVAVSAGDAHTCAATGGGVRCWGDNSSGQLGDGTTAGSAVPVPVTDLPQASAITAGDYHTCAVASVPVCWGSNGFGQLGDGTRSDSRVPVTVLSPRTGPQPEVRDARPLNIIYVDSNGDVTTGEEAESARSRRTVGDRLKVGNPAVLDALRHGFSGATGGRMVPTGARVTLARDTLQFGRRCLERFALGAKDLEEAARPYRQEGAINVVVVDAFACDEKDGVAGFDTDEAMPVVLWNGLESVSTLVHVVLHEYGHDAGLGHAGLTECKDPVRMQECEVIGPTDDYSSLMSYVSGFERFSEVELNALGLLTEDDVIRVTPDAALPRRIELHDAQSPGPRLLVLEAAVAQQPVFVSWDGGDLQIRQVVGEGSSGQTTLLSRGAAVRSERVFDNETLSMTFVGTDAEGDAVLDLAPQAPATASPTPTPGNVG